MAQSVTCKINISNSLRCNWAVNLVELAGTKYFSGFINGHKLSGSLEGTKVRKVISPLGNPKGVLGLMGVILRHYGDQPLKQVIG